MQQSATMYLFQLSIHIFQMHTLQFCISCWPSRCKPTVMKLIAQQIWNCMKSVLLAFLLTEFSHPFCFLCLSFCPLTWQHQMQDIFYSPISIWTWHPYITWELLTEINNYIRVTCEWMNEELSAKLDSLIDKKRRCSSKSLARWQFLIQVLMKPRNAVKKTELDRIWDPYGCLVWCCLGFWRHVVS